MLPKDIEGRYIIKSIEDYWAAFQDSDGQGPFVFFEDWDKDKFDGL
jgi:hypothetical protein